MHVDKRRDFLKIELVSILTLLMSAIMFAVYVYLQLLLFPNANVLTPLGSAQMILIGTVVVGFFPVVLFGSPIYFLLKKYNKNTWLVVLVVGLTPGASASMLGLFGNSFNITGISSLIIGAIVASVTHILCRK